MTRLSIDPVTRVDGALRIEVELDGGNNVTDAWAAGTVYRGLERILEGRDARDAWLMAQRICATDGPAHGLAAVQAIENALGVSVPRNARLLRNLLVGSRTVIDHVAHFYLRHAVDWVDVMAARRGEPGAAATISRARSNNKVAESVADFATARAELNRLFETNQPGPFKGGPWLHPAYRLGHDESLVVMKHALDAIGWQRRMTRLQALLGGKSPHPQTLLVGGLTLAPVWGGPRRPDEGEHPWIFEQEAPLALSADGLALANALVADARLFVEAVFLPDVLSIAAADPEWVAMGRGIGHYLAFGAFALDDGPTPAHLLPTGRVMGRDLTRVIDVAASGVTETTAHSHYDDPDGALRSPSVGRTVPAYGGPALPYASLEGFERYSWVKSPRYEDDPMEVGPAARLLVALAARSPSVTDAVAGALGPAGLSLDDLGSTLGRVVARAIEAGIVVRQLGRWLDNLVANLATGDLAIADITRWDRGSWPRAVEGFALGESARGAIGHWVAIEAGRIASYQIVDANTWNVSPRDPRGRRGALEQALIGTHVADAARPLELLRTIHSFDPCLACGVH